MVLLSCIATLKIAAIAATTDFATSSMTYHFWEGQKNKSASLKKCDNLLKKYRRR